MRLFSPGLGCLNAVNQLVSHYLLGDLNATDAQLFHIVKMQNFANRQSKRNGNIFGLLSGEVETVC